MRCQKQMNRDCPTSEACELLGCQQPYGPPPGTAVARERQPIDLPPLPDYQPGPLMRAVMRLTDAGAAAVKRGPTPFAVNPEPAVTPVLAPPQESPPMSEAIKAAPIAPAPSNRAVSEIRARRVGSGWLLYANGTEIEVATDGSIGGLIDELARR